jgi:outer membrane protein
MKKIILSLAVVASLMSCSNDKTAYVNNSELIQGYYKMKTTEERFDKKSQSLSEETQERERVQDELVQKQQRLQQQQQEKSQRLRQESDEAINSLVTEVKDFVTKYGKANGYTYIFGSNESANIMYAEEGRDITDAVLEELNAEEDEKEEKTSRKE